MSTGWSTTTSKKGRKKKVAAIEKKGNPDNEKRKKKSAKARRKNNKSVNNYNNNDDGGEYKENDYYYYYNNNNNNNNEYGYDINNNEYGYERLNSKQYRISQQISQFLQEFSPNYKCDHILPKIITSLNLTYFDPKDEALKIQILDCIVSELQDAMVAATGKHKQNKNTNNNNNTIANTINNTNENNENNEDNVTMNRKSKKSGKFQQFLVEVGSVFFEYLDKETMSRLIRIKSFGFIKEDIKILTNKQRLLTYTSRNDIKFRINKFNNKLNTKSQLKLYKIKQKYKYRDKQIPSGCKSNINRCLYIIICNALKLLPSKDRDRDRDRERERKKDRNVIVNVDNNLSMATKKIIKSKLPQFNIWAVTNITDLNEAYMTEFGEYNNNKDVNGEICLNYLNNFILDQSVLSKQNIKSMHCAYLKVIKNYELHSFLWLFIELKTKNLGNKDGCKQFMVWNGQCGIKPITINKF